MAPHYKQFLLTVKDLWAKIPTTDDYQVPLAVASLLLSYQMGFWRQTRTGAISDKEFAFRLLVLILLSAEFKLSEFVTGSKDMPWAAWRGIEVALFVIASGLAYSGYVQRRHPAANKDWVNVAWLLENMSLVRYLDSHESVLDNLLNEYDVPHVPFPAKTRGVLTGKVTKKVGAKKRKTSAKVSTTRRTQPIISQLRHQGNTTAVAKTSQPKVITHNLTFNGSGDGSGSAQTTETNKNDNTGTCTVKRESRQKEVTDDLKNAQPMQMYDVDTEITDPNEFFNKYGVQEQDHYLTDEINDSSPSSENTLQLITELKRVHDETKNNSVPPCCVRTEPAAKTAVNLLWDWLISVMVLFFMHYVAEMRHPTLQFKMRMLYLTLYVIANVCIRTIYS